jgi:nucleoside-diphosphate-sugar epimerase
VSTTLLPALARKAILHEPLQLHGLRGYRQNFVHVRDVAEIAIALAVAEDVPSVVNAFSDDTLGLHELVDLIRARLGSTSPVVDNTDGKEVPEPVFANSLAKRVHPRFRRLADHLLDAA